MTRRIALAASAWIGGCVAGPNYIGESAAQLGASTGEQGSEGPAVPGTTEAPSSDETGASPDLGDPPVEVVDPCLAAVPPDCPSGCVLADVRRALDDSCTIESTPACVTAGDAYSGPRSTFWTLDGEGPRLLEVGPCNHDFAPSPEAGWRPCLGNDEDPPECACFCHQGYCAGSEEPEALDACGDPSPCGTLLVEPGLGAADHETEACILEALRAGTPGRYEVLTSGGFTVSTTVLYVRDGGVSRVESTTGDVFCVEVWDPAERCVLAPPAFFDACMQADTIEEECVQQVDAWVDECVVAPPSCE